MVGGAVRAGKAFVEIVLYDKQLKRGLAMVQVNMRRFGQQLTSIGRASAAFLAPAAGSIAYFAKAAADAEEAANKFNAVFMEMSYESEKAASQLAKDMNRSKLAIMDAMATFQTMLVGSGWNRSDARLAAQELTSMAYDIASFNNLADADAVQKVLAAMSGESEPLARFVKKINETAVGLELLNMGFKGTAQTAPEALKQLARLNIIRQAMSEQGSIGDAARTSDSFTNTLKGLKSSVQDTAVAIGQSMLPPLAKFVDLLGGAVRGMRLWAENNELAVRSLVNVVAQLAFAAGAIYAVGKALSLTGAAITFFSSPLNAVIVGLAAVAGAMVDWGDVLKDMEASLNDFGKTLETGNFELIGEHIGIAVKRGFFSAIQDIGQSYKDFPLWFDVLTLGQFQMGGDVIEKRVKNNMRVLDEQERGLRNRVRFADKLSAKETELTRQQEREAEKRSQLEKLYGPFTQNWIDDPHGIASNWKFKFNWWDLTEQLKESTKGGRPFLDTVNDSVRMIESSISSMSSALNRSFMWMADGLNSLTESARDFVSNLEAGQNLFLDTRTPVERAKMEIERIQKLLEGGFTTEDVAQRAIDNIKEQLTEQLQMPMEQISRFSRGALVGGFRAGQVFNKASTYERTMSEIAKRQLEKLTELVREAKKDNLIFAG